MGWGDRTRYFFYKCPLGLLLFGDVGRREGDPHMGSGAGWGRARVSSWVTKCWIRGGDEGGSVLPVGC